MTGNAGPGPDGAAVRAITFDFGNTLVEFTGPQMASTVRLFADRVQAIDPALVAEELIRVWSEERARQLREDVPRGVEMDMPTRAVRVLARLRGCPAPAPETAWVTEEAVRYSAPDEVESMLAAYVDAFLATTPAPPEIEPFLGRLSRRFELGIVSNWPLTAAIERFVEVAGWRRHLRAVVVSHSAGCIKPRPEIFEIAARDLAVESGPAILHVGDDLAADVGGAKALGWRAAWISRRPEGSPLPVATVTATIAPDIEIAGVLDLEAALPTLQP